MELTINLDADLLDVLNQLAEATDLYMEELVVELLKIALEDPIILENLFNSN